MKIRLMLNCLNFHHIIHEHDTTVSMHQHWYPVLAKNILGSRLIVCCKLAPSLARQM